MIIILYMFMSCFPLMFYPISLLLLSYHIMSSSCLILLVIYLLTLACLCSRHDFSNVCLWFRFVDTLVLIYACHLAFTSPLAGESDSSEFSCPGLGAWTEGDSSCWGPSLLLRSWQTSCSSSPILPLLARGIFSYLVSALLYYSYLYIFIFSHLRLSVM